MAQDRRPMGNYAQHEKRELLMIHHSNVMCDDCGERHTPGNKEECIEILKQQLANLEEGKSDRINLRDQAAEGGQ